MGIVHKRTAGYEWVDGKLYRCMDEAVTRREAGEATVQGGGKHLAKLGVAK